MFVRLFFFSCSFAYSYAQAPDTLWTRYWGGNGEDAGIACVAAGNASTIVAGWDGSHGNGKNVMVARIADSGQNLWTRYYGRSSTDEGYSIVRIGENSFAVGGWTTVTGVGAQFYLIVINGFGDTLWTKHYGGSETQKCYDLVKTSKTDGFAMVGYTNSGGSDDVMLLRVSGTGDSLWSRAYGGTSGDVGWSIVETIDHGFLLAGYTDSYGHGDRDIYLIRTNAGGDTLWTRTIGGGQLDWAYYANNSSDGGYVIGGYTVSFRQSGFYNAYFLKINDAGNTAWSSVVPNSNGGTSIGTSICQTEDRYFVAGHGEGAGQEPNVFAALLNSTGEVVWSEVVGGADYDYGREGIVKPDGSGYVVAGNTRSYGSGNYDAYVVFLDGRVQRELTVLSPNGGEEWVIGNAENVTWRGTGFNGDVSLEINRDYPNGGWEFWGVYDNDGFEAITVTGPPSDHCRIRAAAFEDTLSDISDADFSIVNALPIDSLIVLVPNGNERWRISNIEPITWFGSGFAGNVRIELNRGYPTGSWETLFASTVHDGAENFTVTGPPSELCRIRVSALSEALSDISDANFTIFTAQGYLALVNPTQPGAPISNWNAGIVECPQIASAAFRLKNFGEAAISVSRVLEPASLAFSAATTCPATLTLNPGQMSTCTVTLTFDPNIDGVMQDTLLIPSDAANAVGGFVRVPLVGTKISTPVSPTITINMRSRDATLRWQPVVQSTGDCAIVTTLYYIFTADRADGPFTFLTATANTSYVHTGVGNFFGKKFYRVTAVH